MLELIKIGWTISLAIVGAIAGAVLLGGFSSIPLTILGGIIGLPVGYLIGRYIPIWEWFS
jgi:hypothetical protein